MTEAHLPQSYNSRCEKDQAVENRNANDVAHLAKAVTDCPIINRGLLFPLGWQWATSRAVAWSFTAAWKTSLGTAMQRLVVPIETMLI